MKKLISFSVVLIFASQMLYAQWINNISMYPPNPTVTDNIKVAVLGSFSSGGWSYWNIVNQYQIGNELSYYILHCIGMLSYICDNTDTIQIGLLPAGSYSVIINLSAGFNGPPCTQALPWTVDTAYFTVSPLTGIAEAGPGNTLVVRPNPVTGGRFSLTLPEESMASGSCNISVCEMSGREISRMFIPMITKEMNIEMDLPTGIYILSVSSAGKHFKPARLVVL